MPDLPTLNLTCLKNPQGECMLVADSCVNCHNRDALLAHAKKYDLTVVSIKTFDKIKILTKDRIRAESARDAVLALADLRLEDIQKKQGGLM